MQSKPPMKELVLEILKSKLPSTYYYHDHVHTLYVLDKAIEIAGHENCTAKEIELLSAAALWHDTGFINLYTGHEEESCKLARKFLPAYGYSEADINIVCGMIHATRLPQSPLNKLEEILADADLEYLGTANAGKMAEVLFRERRALYPSLTETEWNSTQISFVKNHRYFTHYCRETREPVKQAYLEELQNSL